MSSSASSALTFGTARAEFQDAWNRPSNTRFELPPVNVNQVLRDRYRVTPEGRLTRALLWDLETRKAWDPLTYIPSVVSEGRSWDRHTLSDGSVRFFRSSLQRGFIAPERGRVLEDVYLSNADQAVLFLGRPQMTAEDGKELQASASQSLFHVEHAVGGTAHEPLNLWRIVFLTPEKDVRYERAFEHMASAG